MKKLYLLTFMLLGTTALASTEGEQSMWDPVEPDSSKQILSVNDETGEVSSWSELDGGEGATAGDLEKATTATRYQDTQWGGYNSAVTVEKVEETVHNSNIADEKYAAASSAHSSADDAYTYMKTLENAKDIAQEAYDDAVKQKQTDCLTMSQACFDAMTAEIEAKNTLDNATELYDNAASASANADNKFKQSVEDLRNANSDVAKVMSKVNDANKASELRSQVSNIDMNKWDTYMQNDDTRKALQDQFAYLNKAYDVPNYNLNNEAERTQAQKFINSLNQNLAIQDMSDSTYSRLYYKTGSDEDGPGGDKTQM